MNGTVPKTSNLGLTNRSKARATPPKTQKRIRTRNYATQRFVTQQELRGGKMTVPTNPPDINYQPWCPVILVLQHSGGELKAKIKDISQRLCLQLDPLNHGFKASNDATFNKDGGPLLQLKFRSIRAWNLTGHMIALSVNDLISDNKKNTDTLCGLVDTGSTTHTPAVGYEYPQSHKDVIFHNDGVDMDDPVFHVITPAGDTSVVYVSLFWRFDGPSKMSAFTQSMMALVRSVRTDVGRVLTNTTQMTRDIDEARILLEKIENHTDSGGIGNAIYKGVEVAAPLVIPVVAGEDRQLIERLSKALEGTTVSAASSFACIDGEH